MPSWSSSEPQDEQPSPSAAPTPANEVEAARRLLQELFEDAPADDGDDPAPRPRQ